MGAAVIELRAAVELSGRKNTDRKKYFWAAEHHVMTSSQVSVATETVLKPGALPGGSAGADNYDDKELMGRNGRLEFEFRYHIKIIIVNICTSSSLLHPTCLSIHLFLLFLTS